MFEPKSKMTPQAEADFLIQEIRDTRTAYDNATVDKWRAQHLGMIGLRMSALVRAARKVLAAAHPTTQSDTDADQCTMLEARTRPSRPEAAILVILENTSGTGWLLLTIAHARNDVPLR